MLKNLYISIILYIISICFIGIQSFAQNSSNIYLDQLENNYFNKAYSQESVADRLSRIENTIFGQQFNSDSEQTRFERIKAVLNLDKTQPIPPISESSPFANSPHAISKNKSTQKNQSLSNKNETSSSNQITQSNQLNQTGEQPQQYNKYNDTDQEIEDYPTVSYIENKVFNQTYKGEDITKRLDRLEQSIFNQTKSDMSLGDRVDALKIAVIGNQSILPPQNNSYQQQPYNNQNEDPYQQPYSNNGFNQDSQYPNSSNYSMDPNNTNGEMTQESLQQITTRLEEQVLGQSFPNDQIFSRLDRLEMHVFNKTSPGQTPEARLERLIAVNAASNTSDPNDLKKVNRLRKIQTGLTVGGLLFSILQGLLF